MERKMWLLAVVLVFLFGCAEIKPPMPMEIIKYPLGDKPEIKIGMSKEQVKKNWGEPDKVEELSTDQWGITKEKWTYLGQYPGIPVDYKYLSSTKILYFDGDNLTKVETQKK